MTCWHPGSLTRSSGSSAATRRGARRRADAVVVEERTGRRASATLDIASTPPATGWWTSTRSRARSAARRASSFFRLDLVARPACGSTRGSRPNFEDGHFAVRYVLELAEPRIGVVPSREVPVPAARRRHVVRAAQPRRPGPVQGRVRARLPGRHRTREGASWPAARVAPAGPRLRADLVPDGGRAPHRDRDPGRRPRPGVPRSTSAAVLRSWTRTSSPTTGSGRLKPSLARHLQPCRPTGAVAVADGGRDRVSTRPCASSG